MPGSTACTTAAKCRRRHAGHMSDAIFSSCTPPARRRWRTETVRRIALLYAVEQDIRGQPLDVRARQRHARAGPILKNLRAWLDETLARVSGRSDLAVAIRYAPSRWEVLNRYVADGRLKIDNNPIERAIRPLVLG